MELNFDKEIDALLRQAAKSGSFAADANGSNSASHIDADALSAFAENALPEKTRALYMTHLGDCDRCRMILSNLITLNSEPWPPAASTIETPAIAVAPAPWYRRLFIFPNLAYTMGALVLVFGGLLGFVVLRNLGGGAATEVSQVANKEPVRPAAAPQPPIATGNMNSVSAPDTNSSANASATPPVNLGMNFETNSTRSETGSRENNFKLSDQDKAEAQPGTAGPPTADITTERGDDVVRTAKERNPEPVTNADEKKNRDTATQAKPAPPPPPPAKSAPYDGITLAKDAEAGRAKPDAPANASRKQLAGKSFNRRDGVWYDSAYSGQATTDVRRGTDQYRKLDSGLRSIADSLSGTVVVVWKEKAYRIQ